MAPSRKRRNTPSTTADSNGDGLDTVKKTARSSGGENTTTSPARRSGRLAAAASSPDANHDSPVDSNAEPKVICKACRRRAQGGNPKYPHHRLCTKSIYFGIPDEQADLLAEARKKRLRDTIEKKSIEKQAELSNQADEVTADFPDGTAICIPIPGSVASSSSSSGANHTKSGNSNNTNTSPFPRFDKLLSPAHLCKILDEAVASDTKMQHVTRAPQGLEQILQYIHSLAPVLRKGTNQPVEGRENELKQEWYRSVFPPGTVTWTIPRQDAATVTPHALYRAIEGLQIAYVRWELQCRDRPLKCCYCRDGDLIASRLSFTKSSVIPVLGLEGKPCWVLPMNYHCHTCGSKILANDAHLLHSLPLWMQKAYPVEAGWTRKSQQFQISRAVGDVLEALDEPPKDYDMYYFVADIVKKNLQAQYNTDKERYESSCEHLGVKEPAPFATYKEWFGTSDTISGSALRLAHQDFVKLDLLKAIKEAAIRRGARSKDEDDDDETSNHGDGRLALGHDNNNNTSPGQGMVVLKQSLVNKSVDHHSPKTKVTDSPLPLAGRNRTLSKRGNTSPVASRYNNAHSYRKGPTPGAGRAAHHHPYPPPFGGAPPYLPGYAPHGPPPMYPAPHIMLQQQHQPRGVDGNKRGPNNGDVRSSYPAAATASPVNTARGGSGTFPPQRPHPPPSPYAIPPSNANLSPIPRTNSEHSRDAGDTPTSAGTDNNSKEGNPMSPMPVNYPYYPSFGGNKQRQQQPPHFHPPFMPLPYHAQLPPSPVKDPSRAKAAVVSSSQSQQAPPFGWQAPPQHAGMWHPPPPGQMMMAVPPHPPPQPVMYPPHPGGHQMRAPAVLPSPVRHHQPAMNSNTPSPKHTTKQPNTAKLVTEKQGASPSSQPKSPVEKRQQNMGTSVVAGGEKKQANV